MLGFLIFFLILPVACVNHFYMHPTRLLSQELCSKYRGFCSQSAQWFTCEERAEMGGYVKAQQEA